MAAFYLDNDVDVALAGLLRGLRHTATTARDLGLRAAPDADQQLLAAQNGRPLVTRNAGHFRVLHEAWRSWTVARNVIAVRSDLY